MEKVIIFGKKIGHFKLEKWLYYWTFNAAYINLAGSASGIILQKKKSL